MSNYLSRPIKKPSLQLQSRVGTDRFKRNGVEAFRAESGISEDFEAEKLNEAKRITEAEKKSIIDYRKELDAAVENYMAKVKRIDITI